MSYCAYPEQEFNALLKVAARRNTAAKIFLRLAVMHTQALSLRRPGQWVLTVAQLGQLARTLPEFRNWLLQRRLINSDDRVLLGERYFKDIIICKPCPHKLIMPTHAMQTSLLVSDCWRDDVNRGFYDVTSTLEEWLEAFATLDIPLARMNGLVSVTRPEEAGLLYETQIINGMALMGTESAAGPIVQLMPADFELSFAQIASLYGAGNSPLQDKLVKSLAQNDFSGFGEQRLMYVVKAQVYGATFRRKFDKARYQADLSLPVYEPLESKAEYNHTIADGSEIIVVGKYDPLGAPVGLDVADHRHGISLELYHLCQSWQCATAQAGVNPYLPQGREKFNAEVQRLLATLPAPIVGHLHKPRNACFKVTEIYALQVLEHCYEVHRDNRAARRVYGAPALSAVAEVGLATA